MHVKTIGIIGPESTGKSELSAALAQHYNGVRVPEYARQYLDQHGTDYNFDTLGIIADGQVASINEAVLHAGQRPVFIDTDLLVIQVWSEFVFNKCDNRLLTRIAADNRDAYLLCDVDLPWQADSMREYPDLKSRQVLFQYYRELLQEQPAPWAVINGTGEQRTANAVAAVDRLLINPGS